MSELRQQVESVLDEVEVFFGEATDAEAAVYVYYPMREYLPDGVDLVATVTGPTCAYARTLQASVPMRDHGPGPFSLAEAHVPDPCFWTPEAPYLYEVSIEAVHNEATIAVEKRTLAIRRLGVDGRSFYLDAKRWVPRAVSLAEPSTATLKSFHNQSLAIVVADPDDKLCREATQRGVLLVASITADDEIELRKRISQLERFGAVGLVVVSCSKNFSCEGESVGRNVVVCHEMCDNDPHAVPDWADAVLYRVGDPQQAASFAASCERPTIAWRSIEGIQDVAEARAACDSLQRELAPHGDFAAYFV
ncbi:MAG: hypothetical protein MI757_00890 [Pirellulales bacterium]|nr:hypothetical protein [Pirellulales bacterium]